MAVAPFLKAGNNLPQVCLPSTAAYYVAFNHYYKMKVVRHNDIVLYLDHWIVHVDAIQQFLFYHFAYLREVNFRGERVAIRLAYIACYIA